jgi:hemoglobin-like flavoprotein/uncharacterized protein YjbI with pentapeptide repeats
MSLNVELLEHSFQQIKPQANEFVASFYENLFIAHPEVKPLFANIDMATQQKKLLNALVLVVENLRNPETLGIVLNTLGARHVGYGAIPKYYPAVGEALLNSFEQYLQEDWTPELKQAWVDAFRAITVQMLKGANENYEDVQLKDIGVASEKQAAIATVTQTEQKIEKVPDSEALELPVDLLEKSFAKIKPRAEEFVASFYENLFIAHPEVKPLFAKIDMAIQQKKLLNSLILVVENIRNPEVLGNVLNTLGARHVGYGALPKYYPAVGEALLSTFEQYLQQDWTPQVKQAWLAAFRAITAAMLKGAGEESAPIVVQTEKAAASKYNSELNSKVQPVEVPIEKQKNSLGLIQNSGEKLNPIADTITNTSRQFQPHLSVQRGYELLKQIQDKFINAFWTQPAWLVATVAVVIMVMIFVVTDENSQVGKVLGSVEPISVVVALVLFIKEAPDRRKQFHYQAWSTIDAAHGVKVSNARILALQDLNADGVSLRGLDTPGADLVAINLSKANLSESNLNKTDFTNANLSHANLSNTILSHAKLSGANLSHANLSFARLNKANLSSANLSSANLICADLSRANMSGVNLKNASLSGANLEGTYLTGANLKEAKVSSSELRGAFLEGAIMPDELKQEMNR